MCNNFSEILTLNKNILLGELNDGKQYIIIKKEKKYIPLFLKKSIIDILHFVKNTELSKSQLLEVYNIKEIELNCLIEAKILIEKSSELSQVDICVDENAASVKLNNLAVKTRTPLTGKLELTYACNYKCRYCYVDNLKSEFMKLEDVKHILNELKDIGVKYLFITGGEPFLHKDIIEIIKYSEELNFIITIQTNGSMITQSIMNELKSIDKLKIVMSYHSCNESKFDSFTQVDGSFKKVINLSKEFKKNNIDYFFKYTVTSDSERELKANIKFLEERKIPFKIHTLILPNIEDVKNNGDYNISEESIRFLHENGYMKFNKSSCSAAMNKIWISPNGDVYPCELVREPIGNIFKENIKEIWYGDKSKKVLKSELFITDNKCIDCELSEYCNKCLAYLDYKSWTAGLSYFCRQASIIKDIYSR